MLWHSYTLWNTSQKAFKISASEELHDAVCSATKMLISVAYIFELHCKIEFEDLTYFWTGDWLLMGECGKPRSQNFNNTNSKPPSTASQR